TWPIAVQVHVVRTNLSPTTTLLKSKAVGTSSGAGRRDLGEQPIDSCERAVALATDIKGAL
ncbi:MAG: hypothetical protein ACXWP5_14945, partial [Bdellovibrionota bacterium]